MVKVMSGYRVLDVGMWTFGPLTGGVLADWGADVVKIEHPVTGDPQRGLVTSDLFKDVAVVDFVMEHANRGKRSIGLDLASLDGRPILERLVARSDVFITSFLPDARQRLRIDVDDIRAINPDIVYARASADGPNGPEANRGSYDNCSFWARAGSGDGTFLPGMDYPIPQPGGAYGDTIAALILASGIATALLHRERTGEALVVDTSLLGVGAWAAAFNIAGCHAWNLERFPSMSRDEIPNPIVNIYRTADDRFIQLNMLESDRYWADLAATLGRPELAQDPRFADSRARTENRTACIEVLDGIFGARPLQEWKDILADFDGIWAPVQRPSEVLDDPQVVANHYVRDVVGADGKVFKLVAAPIQFNEKPADIRRGPAWGEHTDEVLQELGYEMDEIIDLKVKGAVL